MKGNDEPLTDAEYAQALEDHALLQAAYRAKPEETLQAMSDAIQLPRFEGEL